MRGTWNSLVLMALLAIPPVAGAQQVRSHAGPPPQDTGFFEPITGMTGRLDGTTLLLEWPRPEGTNGTFSHYDLYYSTAGPVTLATQRQATYASGFWTEPSPDNPDNDIGILENAPFTQTTIYHVGLTYWTVVQGVEGPEYTQIEFSNDVQIDVDVTPPAAVTALTAVGRSESSLQLSWPAPGDNGMEGMAASYEFRYSTFPPAGDPETWWAAVADPLPVLPPTPEAPGSIQQILVTALHYDTRYFFAVRTTDDRQLVSSLSNIADAVTLPRDTGTSSGGSVPGCGGSAAGLAAPAVALLLLAIAAPRLRNPVGA